MITLPFWSRIGLLGPRDWNSLLTRSGDMFIFRSVSGSGAYSCLQARHSLRITRPAPTRLSWLIAFFASPTSFTHCCSASNVWAGLLAGRPRDALRVSGRGGAQGQLVPRDRLEVGGRVALDGLGMRGDRVLTPRHAVRQARQPLMCRRAQQPDAPAVAGDGFHHP